ncbi:hypothetical protein JZX87_13920 [Agrobacterium sp. Ap1]|uniref:hypothetical protein n=1 Tax=Agrobacterium sp. Ap1 TaxID=2815337 RepID=UPI001A8BF4AA|nr:hypothetical protein [Agrobacterium sp. Ap1]MBO0142260.1 hypothetical protein [Agrobacterium sp. Ap1]
MTTPANPLRGEAEITIGRETFRIAVTFSGLVRLSKATKVDTLDELHRRLLGFEPFTVACAVRTLIVADDQDRAAALSAKILADDNISIADQDSWRAGMEEALLGHVTAGAAARDERSAHQFAEDALLGEPVSPS